MPPLSSFLLAPSSHLPIGLQHLEVEDRSLHKVWGVHTRSLPPLPSAYKCVGSV